MSFPKPLERIMVGIWTTWPCWALARLPHPASHGTALAGLAFHCLMGRSRVLPMALARGKPENLA
eukprot:1771367-Heterocapsa_arctica.AAC.1